MPESVKRSNLQRSINGELPGNQVEAGVIDKVYDVTVSSCLDESGHSLSDDCLEDCKQGDFNAQVQVVSQVADENGLIESVNRIMEVVSVSGNYHVTNYDRNTKWFTVAISGLRRL